MALYELAERWLVPLQLILATFGMGATLGLKDFLRVLRRPTGLALGLTMQLGLIPALAAGFIWGLELGPGWAVGLLLISAAPAGPASNLYTYLARGNVPLSIAMTLLSMVLCMGSIPILLGFWAGQFLPGAIEVPTARVSRDILLFLLLPMMVGMGVYRFWPQRSEKISKRSIQASVVVVVIVILSAMGAGRIKVWEYGWGPPAVIVGFTLTLAVLPPTLMRLLGRGDDESSALGIGALMRSMGLGLLLVPFFFQGQEAQGHVLYSCLLFAGVSGPMAWGIILSMRAGRGPWFFLGARKAAGCVEALGRGSEVAALGDGQRSEVEDGELNDLAGRDHRREGGGG
jgi:BASS family bile acid:Na+ symporter